MGVDGLSKAEVFDEYFDSDEKEQERIPSFSRDHDNIQPGIYLQEHKRNILVYDLRFTKPNTQVIPIEAIHTIEHLLATWLKVKPNQIKDITVSFNPGGCQTMFYLEIFDDFLVQGNYRHIDMLKLISQELSNCIDWCVEQTEVPGATQKECGNYKSHDLVAAKQWLMYYQNVLEEQFSKTNF